ncbi:SanA/YdcF family protein [Stackebrandtia nassauensis]|nr:ElyC/SanA/YdcF family protein [Stackebrandtia nassauensis]
MVLGARVYEGGRPSPFLEARLELARRLYEAGKAEVVLVSGDNGQEEYNEVDPMREWLIERGVPGERVVGDYAGFDTYDSCVRAREVFGVEALTVVTQGFHVERAVTLCRQAGIEANGVGDDSVRRYPRPWKVGTVREWAANVKAGWDVLMGREPVYPGPRESSVEDVLRGR